MMLKSVNYLTFQIGWFACVLGAAHAWPLAGPAVVAAVVAFHVRVARVPGREAALLALCALGGGAFDSLLLASGWIVYSSGGWIPGAAPYWIVAMWVLFGTTLNMSLSWLRTRPWLAAGFGAAGAPLAYIAGAELGAMQFVDRGAALLALAVGWAVLMPALGRLALALDGMTPERSGSRERVPHAAAPIEAAVSPGVRARPVPRPISRPSSGHIKPFFLAWVTVLSVLAAVNGWASPGPPVSAGEWAFRVFVDEREVGTHRFTLADRGARLELRSVADFEYRLLFVTLYRYRHENREIWDGDCLARIDSETDANGKPYEVAGRLEGDGFVVDGTRGERTLPDCVMSFAYWNPRFLRNSRLLNTQTGEYLDVEISRPEPDTVRVGERAIPAWRYRLTAREIDLHLWYSDEQEWLGLETRYENGRTLRYELITEPQRPFFIAAGGEPPPVNGPAGAGS